MKSSNTKQVACLCVVLLSTISCGYDASKTPPELNSNVDVCAPHLQRFGASQTTGTAPLSVTFTTEFETASSSCSQPTFFWSVDGATQAVTKEPSKELTFSLAGTYAVSVSAATAFKTAVTSAIDVTVFLEEEEKQLAPLHTFALTREFEDPVTVFSAASSITAEALVRNSNAVEVWCESRYTWGLEAHFRLYEEGIVVARSPVGLVLWMSSTVIYPPGDSAVRSSTINYWETPTGSTFQPYPGVFTMAVVPGFHCDTPVQIEPHTIQIVP